MHFIYVANKHKIGESWSLEKEKKVFNYYLNYSALQRPQPKESMVAWQLRWELGAAVPVAKDLGLQDIQKNEQALEKSVKFHKYSVLIFRLDLLLKLRLTGHSLVTPTSYNSLHNKLSRQLKS